MKVRAVVVVVSVVVFMVSGCDTSPTLDESTPPTSEPATSTTSPGGSASPSTSKPAAAPQTQPAERRLTGFSWEATPWVGHRIASDITISVDDRLVTASFGETQTGQLTEFGAGEIQRLVDEVSLEKTPEDFTGPERWDWADESTFAITLTVGGEVRTYRYTGTPPPQLSALDCFLWNQIHPLSFCESTEAVEVQEPCTYLGVD